MGGDLGIVDAHWCKLKINHCCFNMLDIFKGLVTCEYSTSPLKMSSILNNRD